MKAKAGGREPTYFGSRGPPGGGRALSRGFVGDVGKVAPRKRRRPERTAAPCRRVAAAGAAAVAAAAAAGGVSGARGAGRCARKPRLSLPSPIWSRGVVEAASRRDAGGRKREIIDDEKGRAVKYTIRLEAVKMLYHSTVL